MDIYIRARLALHQVFDIFTSQPSSTVNNSGALNRKEYPTSPLPPTSLGTTNNHHRQNHTNTIQPVHQPKMPLIQITVGLRRAPWRVDLTVLTQRKFSLLLMFRYTENTAWSFKRYRIRDCIQTGFLWRSVEDVLIP